MYTLHTAIKVTYTLPGLSSFSNQDTVCSKVDKYLLYAVYVEEDLLDPTRTRSMEGTANTATRPTSIVPVNW